MRILQNFLWHMFFKRFLKLNMQSINDPGRNRPADEGKRNDPNLRDDSASQPGVNTMSNSDYDDDNKDLTETAADSFRGDDLDENADPDLDDIHEDADNEKDNVF